MHGRVLRAFERVLLMLIVAAVGQAALVRASENPRQSREATGHAQEPSTAGQSGARESGAENGKTDERTEIAAMQSDLQRTRVLMNQMQMNLAFVQNTNTPLKHQFELEIEMWQILIKQIERRLDSMVGEANPR
ncbi:MAG TPA: hypothetical protein VFJ47_07610 [Terriglobales bacterium]|nr:hypothetical protein [Terriglobales bacterium]